MSKERPITERKTRFDGTVQEFACQLLRVEPGKRALIRYEADRDWQVGDLQVPIGTVTVGHFWADRPYNVYHWLKDGRTLGHYFNVGLTDEIGEKLVAWRDLIVDVLIRPDGSIEILDEDELPADLPSEHRSTIARALEQIVTNPLRLCREIDRESRDAL